MKFIPDTYNHVMLLIIPQASRFIIILKTKLNFPLILSQQEFAYTDFTEKLTIFAYFITIFAINTFNIAIKFQTVNLLKLL